MDLTQSLHDACLRGNLDLVQHISSLPNFYNCYNVDDYGMSPFSIACKFGHLPIAQLLFTFDFIDVTHLNMDGFSALDLACHDGLLDIVQWLYPLLTPHERNNSLHAAVHGKQVTLVQWLMEQRHPLVNNYEKETPLHIACRVNSTECVQLLCGYGPVDSLNDERQTPFLLACQFGRFPIVQYLYDQGANPHLRNMYHESAFILACGSGNLPLAKWIQSIRVDITALDIYGESALSDAAKLGHTHMISWLCEHLPVNQQSNVGYTPFIQACREGHLDTAKKLYAHGANVHLRDSIGRSPLFHAVYGEFMDLVKWLGSFGIHYEERILRSPFIDTLFLLGACHDGTTLYTTRFMKQLHQTHRWFRLRKKMKEHYDQRILCLGKHKIDFDSWMTTLPWCTDVSLLIGDFVGILRYPQWDRILTVR